MGPPLKSIESAAPYRLRSILERNRIAHKDLRTRLCFEQGTRAGNPISEATFSLLLSRRQWPVSVPAERIKAITEQLLRERGVPDAEIAEAWVIDGKVDAQGNSRKSRHARTNNDAEPGEAPFDLPETEMLSAAAREHFHLAQHPFINDVQGPQDVYLSKDQRYIRESMYYAAKHGGFLAVVGESGSGKSTLRRDLLERIRQDTASIVVIQPQTVDKTVLSAAHICDAIIADLSTEKAKLSLEAKARQVQRILAGSSNSGAVHVLMIEEAHDLNIATLKYLKRFWEMEDGFRKLLGIILIGQPELGDRLDERKNYDAREVIRRCEVARLKSLNGNLEEYLALKFKRVGVALSDVFDADAFDAIRARLTRRRTNGEVESHLYPLVVHNLCAKAMNEAADLSIPKVSAQLIGRI
jgi:type II secretory pathway predicted ATPase ExeA